jgi:hypothetical protein
MGLDVADRIQIDYQSTDPIVRALSSYREFISKEI